MEPPAPAPPSPPPSASRWGWLIFAGFTCILAAILLLGFAGLPLGRKLLQEVAGHGQLQWQGPEGWVTVSSAQDQRRIWNEGSAFLIVDWRLLREGLAFAELPLRRAPNPSGIPLYLLKVDPEKWSLALGMRPGWTKGSVDGMAEEDQFVAAINASYFSEDGPVGLVVSEGELLHPQTRRWAAHLLIPPRGAPRIVNQKKASWSGARYAIQAFPAIMAAGHTFPYMRYGGRGFDVRQVDRRSALCLTWDNQLLLLATDTVINGLSFVELATMMGGLGCRDAMGLDGGTSTGFYLSVDGFERSIGNLKPVPVVLGVRPVGG